MNLVFYLLIAVIVVVLWFIISTFVFEPLGRLISKKWEKTVEILNKEDNITEKKEKEKHE